MCGWFFLNTVDYFPPICVGSNMQIFTNDDSFVKTVLSFGKKVGELKLVPWRLLELKNKYLLRNLTCKKHK